MKRRAYWFKNFISTFIVIGVLLEKLFNYFGIKRVSDVAAFENYFASSVRDIAVRCA